MIRTYLPAIVFLLLGAGLGAAFAVLNTFLGPKRPGRASKQDPYECGLPSEIQRGSHDSFSARTHVGRGPGWRGWGFTASMTHRSR